MEIIQLHLKHFGKFTDYRMDLHTGINIISGANESGKSTLHAFIKAMLYGITRTRGRSLDEYQLREPWENPSYFAGSMKLLYEGKIYRIDRNFHRRDESVEVVCETDGTKAEDPAAAIRYFTGGLEETDFDNTVFIRQAQQEAGVKLGERLRDYLVNREQTADESLDVSAVQEHLKKKRKKIEQDKRAAQEKMEGEISRKTQESEYVTRDLERLLERRAKESAQGAAPNAYERVREKHAPYNAGWGDGTEEMLRNAENQTADIEEEAFRNAENQAADMDEESLRNAEDQAADIIEEESFRNARDQEADMEEESFEEQPGMSGILLPVMVLLSFVASGLLLACAFLTTDHRMRYVMLAGTVLIGIVAIFLLWRMLHPVTKSERMRRKLKREAFLDRHLGFREDPDDSEDRELSLRRETRVREALFRAREEEEEERRQEEARRSQEERRQEEIRRSQEKRRQEEARRSREAERRSQVEQALETRKREDAELLGRDVQRIARTEVLEREISLRREKLDYLRTELEELYRKKAELSKYDEEIRAVGMAQDRIRELTGSIYHESGTEFAREVSLLLAALTKGGYTRISLDEKMLVQLNTQDRLLSLDQVSYGTMQQVYFALRLASAGLLSEKNQVPVILDEPFAMYDEERLESALRLLAGCGRQVILFSCQTRELEMLSRIRNGKS